MNPLTKLAGIAALLALTAAACGTQEPTATPVPPTATSEPRGASLPDTTAASVMEYLEAMDYRNNWDLWPGKGEKYQGVEPHGLLLTTYLNGPALEALNGQAGSMPDGAIIVKENYMPDGAYDAATVMYKVQGYNPEHNDWFWTKVGADGAVQAEGKVKGCQDCHGAKRDNDYIFTGDLG